MSKLMDLELISPEGILLKNKIKELVAVTETGELGVLYNHADLKSKLVPAPLRYKSENNTEDLVAVLGGIIEVSNNKITIVTDFAEKSTDIDEAQAHKAAEEAKAKIQTLSPDAPVADRDLIMAELGLQKELLRLQTAKLRKQL